MSKEQKKLAIIIIGAVVTVCLFVLLAPLDRMLNIRGSSFYSLMFFMALCLGALTTCTGLTLLFDKNSAHHGVGIFTEVLMVFITGVLIFSVINLFMSEGDLIIKIMNILIDSFDLSTWFFDKLK